VVKSNLAVESKKSKTQWLRAKKMLKNLKSSENKTVAEKSKNPVTESKKVAKNLKTSAVVDSKKVAKNLKTSG